MNSAFNEFQPHITSDRKSLYLASDRSGGLGGFDLYEARRTKDSGKK